MNAIRVSAPGGAEVLTLVEVPDPTPGAGDLLVKVHAAGVNFIDVYHRTGLYPLPLPFVPGVEGAGEVVAIGGAVQGFAVGDLVAWAGPAGGYAELVAVPAAKAVRVPAGVAPDQAAAVMLQGMTAHYLSHATFRVRPGHTALVLAAAGGTGQLLTRMIRLAGGRALAAVGSAAKAELALAAGADAAIRYDAEPLAARARELTAGRGVDVVYDSVGLATFEESLRALAPRGMLVLYGQASGKVPPLDPALLASGGSLFLTRPTLFHYIATRAELEDHAGAVLAGVATGALPVRVHAELPLAQASRAHGMLEGRETTGKVLLRP